MHTPSHQEPAKEYDGVLCLGGVDWWYHNRGHYDLRLMEQVSRTQPVLYVNSIGVRRPKLSEGNVFFKRVLRKLSSIRRGQKLVSDRFWVYSPITGPYWRDHPLHRRFLAAQVRRAAKRSGLRKPLIWVACPAAADLALQLSKSFGEDQRPIVHQRTDRFEAFDADARNSVLDQVAELARNSTLTLYCSKELQASDTDVAGAKLFVDHGVDVPALQRAALSEPADLASLPHPRVGFVGGLDRHTFDAELFAQVAKQLENVHFALIGGSTFEPAELAAKNVTLLGRRPLEEVGSYMGHCDVLIMPWNNNDWIRSCNPIKLKEYLAVGKPIVSTPFAELDNYSGLIQVACDAGRFANAIERALNSPHDPKPGLERLEGQGWDAKAEQVKHELAAQGWSAATHRAQMRRQGVGLRWLRRLAIGLGLASAVSCRSLPDAPTWDVTTKAATPPPAMDATLMAGDRFQIRFPAYPQWNEVILVQPDGQANVPLLGLRDVAGRDIGDLEARLGEELSERVRSPRIELAVVERHPRQVFVGGEVDVPGLVAIQGPSLTLTQAIFASGGPLTAKAAMETVILSRVNKQGERESWTVDGRALLNGKAAPVWLVPGDVIWVPNRRIDEANLFVAQYITNMIPGGNLLSALAINQFATQ